MIKLFSKGCWLDMTWKEHKERRSSQLVYKLSIIKNVANFVFPKCKLEEFLFAIRKIAWITLPKTNSSPLKLGRNPKGKDRLPTIHFQGIFVSFREGRLNVWTYPWRWNNCDRPYWQTLKELSRRGFGRNTRGIQVGFVDESKHKKHMKTSVEWMDPMYDYIQPLLVNFVNLYKFLWNCCSFECPLVTAAKGESSYCWPNIVINMFLIISGFMILVRNASRQYLQIHCRIVPCTVLHSCNLCCVGSP